MIRAIRRLRRPASATAVRACSSSAAAAEPYSVQQKKKGRFVSPHLTVHKTTWEIHALSSVTNRVTGVFATIGEFTSPPPHPPPHTTARAAPQCASFVRREKSWG